MRNSRTETQRRVLTVRDKRRSKPTLASRLRTYWIVSVFAIALAAWGTVALLAWNGFHPGSVIVSGAAHTSPADVERMAAIDHRSNIWLQDVRRSERRIESLPYVATARVRRRLPAEVSIDVIERVADGCVHFEGIGDLADLTIDASRRVLAAGCAGAPGVRYVVHGTPEAPGAILRNGELTTLQDDRRALLALGRNFSTYALDRFGGLDAMLPDGIAVKFGDDDNLDTKERLIGPVLAAVANRLDDVAAVDVRAPSAPIVDFR